MTAQSFAYEKKGNSAVIWRCFSRDIRVEIPQEIEGLKVTEIAPYAFSAHMDQQLLDSMIQTGKVRIYIPELITIGEERRQPLCGNRVEEVKIPNTVQRVGRYCFYNCENLRELEYHGSLSDWGSGSFTGCHKIRKLRVWIPENGVTCLKPVLEELREELQVEYKPERMSDQGYAQLVFPEFFEEGIENTPARILEERMHGTGMHYRNCFYNKVFDFRQYDSLFSFAAAQESPATMTALAMGRLRHPFQLGDRAKEEYTGYIKGHAQQAAEQILMQRDTEGLRWLLSLNGQDQKLMDYITERASALHFAEALSYLMEHRKTELKPVRRRREL